MRAQTGKDLNEPPQRQRERVEIGKDLNEPPQRRRAGAILLASSSRRTTRS